MKLKALVNFTLFEEKLEVKKDSILKVEDIEKTIVDEKGNITLSLKRAEAVKAATFKGEPLVEEIKKEIPKKEIEIPEIETADVKPEMETAVPKVKRTRKKVEK